MNAVTKAFKTAKVAACKLSVPLVYNARVAGQVAKQVYIREGMAPPSGAQLEAAKEAALDFVWKARRASTWKNISSDSYAKAALVAGEAYAFFLVGEIIGRRNLVGYDVKAADDGHHH